LKSQKLVEEVSFVTESLHGKYIGSRFGRVFLKTFTEDTPRIAEITQECAHSNTLRLVPGYNLRHDLIPYNPEEFRLSHDKDVGSSTETDEFQMMRGPSEIPLPINRRHHTKLASYLTALTRQSRLPTPIHVLLQHGIPR
jgi:hypothetical protein